MTLGWIPDRPTKCQTNVENSPEILSIIFFDYPGSPPGHPKDSQRSLKSAQQIAEHVQNMHEYSLLISELFMNKLYIYGFLMIAPQISLDYSLIIHRYLCIFHGNIGKASVCLLRLILAVFPKTRFLKFRNIKSRKNTKT